MCKSTGYSKVDRYCDICECDPCDCDGVWDEFRIMGSDGTIQTREEPNMARRSYRFPSLSPMQMEKRIIESENRILPSRSERDIHIEGDIIRIYSKRSRGIDGD